MALRAGEVILRVTPWGSSSITVKFARKSYKHPYILTNFRICNNKVRMLINNIICILLLLINFMHKIYNGGLNAKDILYQSMVVLHFRNDFYK